MDEDGVHWSKMRDCGPPGHNKTRPLSQLQNYSKLLNKAFIVAYLHGLYLVLINFWRKHCDWLLIIQFQL